MVFVGIKGMSSGCGYFHAFFVQGGGQLFPVPDFPAGAGDFQRKDRGAFGFSYCGRAEPAAARARTYFFHLVESNREADFPFAFLATYATKDNHGKINHMPLQYALVEYQTERGKLLKLLSCLNQAAEKSDFVRKAVESGEMFHPLKLTAQEAYQFLKEIPVIEEAGILCRIPNWWKRRAMMVSMNVSLGDEQPSFSGI